MRSGRATAAAVLLAAAGCASMGGAPAQRAPLDQDFQLARGAAVVVDALTVRFTEVMEDSRCPVGVQCIRAGEAKVHLALRTASGQSDNVVLSTSRTQQRYASLGAYDVRLVGLDPPRRTDVVHPRYVATLRVTRR